jgi:predicted permease
VHPEQLSLLKIPGDTSESWRFSYPAYEKFRRAVAPDGQLAAMSSTIMFSAAQAGSQAELVRGQLVTGEWFELLGVQPAAGRLVAPGDREVVVLSNGFWKRMYGANAGVVGSALTVNGNPLHVIGVAPARFGGFIVGDEPDIWMPARMQHELRYQGNASVDDADSSKPWLTQEGIRWLNVIMRTSDQERRSAAMERVNAFFLQRRQELASHESDERARKELLALRVSAVKGARGMSSLRTMLNTPLWVLMAVVGTILVIACANLANLLLARSRARRKEMAVRLALGAGRSRLIRQLLTEAVLLSAIGGVAGLLVAEWGNRALLTMAVGGPYAMRFDGGLDYRILTFAAALSIFTGILFGLAPALRATRVETAPELKSQGRLGGSLDRGTSRYWLGKSLVAVQVAFSLVLVVAAVLFVRTLQNLAAVDPGYDRESVLTARLELRVIGYKTQDLPALYGRILDRVRSMAGVRSAALSLYSLASGSARISGIYVAGAQQKKGVEADAQENFVTPGYFSTVGVELLRGRDFSVQDGKETAWVAIVNETFARRFFPDVEPIGRMFSSGPEDKHFTRIIGVVRDIRVNDLRQKIPPMAYYPLAQHPDTYIRSVDVRAAGDARAAASAIRAAIADVDRNIPVRDVITIAEQLARTMTAERLVARLTALFGALAIVLACVGLFGVMSYTVARRRGELAVRMALGAPQGRVMWLIVRETSLVIGAGVVTGLLISFAVLRAVANLLYGLTPTDPSTMIGAAVLLIAVGILAGGIPAWRASRVDPMIALRYE